MGFFKRIGNFFRERQATRLAARERRMQIRQAGKSDRAAVDANSASERAAIAAQSGYDPTQVSTSGGGALGGFLDKAKGFLGNIFGGGQTANEPMYSGEPPKDNKMMIFGLIGAAVLAMVFMFKPKK